jgi:hypothetical protein
MVDGCLVIADSLKLAVGALLVCLLARAGWLGRLGEPGATAAFLLYFTWPMLSFAFAFLTALLAARDHQEGRGQQAAAAVLLSLWVLAFSLTTFRAFGQ